MVRVISSGFNTPRSRHSSGEEMIDRFSAMKAVSALSENEKQLLFSKASLVTKTLVIDCNTDTNDSFSGLDSEEESCNSRKEENDLHQGSALQDPSDRKKERRRERNKLSAQSYRQRRRAQSSTAQKTLDSLAAHHKILMEKVRHLEAEKNIVEDYLRNCVKIPPWGAYQQSPYQQPPCRPINCSPPPPCIPETESPANISTQSTSLAATSTTNLNLNVNESGLKHDMQNNNNNMRHVMSTTHPVNANMRVMPGCMHSEMHADDNMFLRMSGVNTATESSGSLVS